MGKALPTLSGATRVREVRQRTVQPLVPPGGSAGNATPPPKRGIPANPIRTVLALGLLLAGSLRGTVQLQFKDLRDAADVTAQPAWIMFGGAGELSAKNTADGSVLVKGYRYRLSDLPQGVTLSKFISGRIFISLGAALVSAYTDNGYAPNFANPSLCDFNTRWDKIELTFNPAAKPGNQGGANLTAQDFFGIRLRIDTTGTPAPATLTYADGSTAAGIMQNLGKLAGFKVSTSSDATGAVALGTNGVTIPNVGQAVRIISPASVQPFTAQGVAGTTVYPSFANYLNSLKSGKTIISGNNGQEITGGPLTSYSFTAALASQQSTIGSVTVNPGDLVMSGTMNIGAGDVATALVFPAGNLTDHAIYGADPAKSGTDPGYVLAQGTANPILARAVADYFSALNFGFAGSTVDNPQMPGTPIGASPSWTWYGNKPDGNNTNPLSIQKAFGFAQPSDPTRYNQYAAYLSGVSDAYGFAYNDRLASPLASFDDGSTVAISILKEPALTNVTTAPSGICSVVNSASFVTSGPVAAGSLATVFGTFPATALTVAPGNAALPTKLGGVSLDYSGGTQASLLAVAPQQVNIQVPWEFTGMTSTTLTVTGAPAGTSRTVQLAAYAPGIFTLTANGDGRPAALDAAFHVIDDKNPAQVGSVVHLFATGLGAVNNQPATGAATPNTPLATTTANPTVTVGGQQAQVTFSGLAPGFIGLYQVDFTVPDLTVAAPGDFPLSLSIGGATSNTTNLALH